MKHDPITTEVVRHALETIAEEMGTAMRRTAMSVVIKDLRDYSCAVFDAKGRLLACALDIPGLMAAMAPALQATLAKWRDDIAEGDVFITNHPYMGCAHTSDINIFVPVFGGDGGLVGFTGAIAHHADWGGRVPGTAAYDSRSLYQEGVVLPGLKLFERDTANQAILDIIRENVRHPDQNMGDLRAQLAAARAGRDRFARLAKTYGTDGLQAILSGLIDYTARRVRAELTNLPNGKWSADGAIDDDGITPGARVRYVVDVTLEGEAITFDFSRGDKQMPGGMNIPWASLRSAVQYAITCILPDDIPVNEGVMDAVTIVAPVGGAVNPAHPAAVSDRHIACERLCDVLVKAMGQIAPNRTSAGWCVGFPVFICESASPKTGDSAVLLGIIAGGAGAATDGDGANGIDVHLSNCAIIPAESIESNYMLRIDRYELIQDSGGGGRFRGGLGIRADYRNISGKPLDVQTEVEQSAADSPPWPLDGGRGGTNCSVWMIADGFERPLPSKGYFSIPPGGVVSMRGGGGGGCGDPLARPADLVMCDLRSGFISAEASRRIYGVDPATGARA
ncbi:hydantoinase B/oxoprolinase family protein [Mesorhizobium sp.]|uniref:hydantoinase B/oxoprolinase family protein n=1 Tax=Mesorhizobium sp. TaxID=1871066 RepID=UPI000FEAAE12|nr:hydantoinase B/oxoprolinase family protein [Mesorhizobium sp.]RWD73876.1 MAG: hydantoinase B/oxoprolinase family protein [Mesorhizobium sp.]TIV55918.1 MAG: hydantoinase B/oxoprolinase family protein [Mesorhizobium sp.]